MKTDLDISVVVTTRNRATMLTGALQSIMNQSGEGVRYEVIVVDNNSEDNTGDVIKSFEKRFANLHYVSEKRQGISYGRNAGIAAAQAEIIAFTDDDIRVSNDWLSNIKRVFDKHPEIDYLGGKVLPHWQVDPPMWLTREHWWPVPLVDWGEQPFYVGPNNPICLPTASAAFRRIVFDRVGNFSLAYSGREDHELLVRLWQNSRFGMYDPLIIAFAEIPPQRLTKQYHRRWSLVTGRFNSMMHLNELIGPDGKLNKTSEPQLCLFGVPAFIYRQLLNEVPQWLKAAALGTEAQSLHHQNQILYFIGYIAQRYKDNVRERGHSSVIELERFMSGLVNRKLVSRNKDRRS